MGGGGDTEIKETEAQKAAAEIARKHWEIYNRDLKPFEEMFIQRVDAMNDESQYQKVKQNTDLNYNQQFSGARKQTTDSLAASGVDPSTAKAQETLSNLATEQSVQQSDTVNRAQTAQQDQYVAGLQGVSAMGDGKAMEALSGINDIASMSAQKASADAQNAYNARIANQNLAGTLVGAGVSYGLSKMPTAQATAPQVNMPRLSTQTHGMTSGGMQTNSVKYDPLGRKW